MTHAQKPLPVATPESRPFWEGCRRHELLIQRCAQCRTYVFPPRAICSECLATALEWTRATGRGRVFSYVVYHRVYHQAFATDLPYVVAVVELEEGVRMLSNLIGVPPDQVQCGMPVEVLFEDVAAETTLFKFRGGTSH